jgi:hypothetical protein
LQNFTLRKIKIRSLKKLVALLKLRFLRNIVWCLRFKEKDNGKILFFYPEFWIKGKKNSNEKLSVKRKRLENWEELKKNRENERR